MDQFLAHSARPELGVPAQPYATHVRNVAALAIRNARNVGKYAGAERNRLIRAVALAAEYHDLGKLDESNQAVLAGTEPKRPLPVNHTDAGVAHMFAPTIHDLLAASAVFAHHAGLPDFQDQRNNRAGYVLRDVSPGPWGRTTKELVDERLVAYLGSHLAAMRAGKTASATQVPAVSSPIPPILFRIALSCLVDADHYDTAQNYNHAVAAEGPALRPKGRLRLLDAYVELLAQAKADDRTSVRIETYRACRHADTNPRMYACASPVGTGKTTAVMAHLLRVAADKRLRRVFVVLPFTNIIDQSVDVYRRALVRPGEPGVDVVAAHHHRAEFDAPESRQFAFLWHAPIVVTTAVQFFETLAGNHPAALRKLHQLPGSAVFIDEAHAALPAHLWPQAWRWLRELEGKWGCHFVLGSGSLSRFWELEEFADPPVPIPELLPNAVHERSSKYDRARIRYRSREAPLGLEGVLEWLPTLPGPRALVLNTVQSAAVVARAIAKQNGRQVVEHLSTSLCPRDRKTILGRVKKRLSDPNDREWTLVATSCIEAGLDLSFRTGLRERASLNSLIQIGGRVNREGAFAGAEVWDFELQHDELLRRHPAFDTAARVLGELFSESQVGPEWSTEAMRREVRQAGMREVSREILVCERNCQFPRVRDSFKVIDSDTVTAVVDPGLIAALAAGKNVTPEEIQSLSVQIWRYRQAEWDLKAFERYPGLYPWRLDYDDFLGFMAGVLRGLNHQKHGTVV
ncbi:MAG: CRISPR-associated endonuclease Cas3'' [Thermoanaerobaculales bacterium]